MLEHWIMIAPPKDANGSAMLAEALVKLAGTISRLSHNHHVVTISVQRDAETNLRKLVIQTANQDDMAELLLGARQVPRGQTHGGEG